ncbi:MAG: hypothetical protein FWF94_05265 [Oscillospiraceae bacterium]|nr:hypothetical protein [Oscillospiraceae bacterium]
MNYTGRKRTGLMVVVLSVLTLWLYKFYWLYIAMEDINRTAEDELFKSTLYLIISIFCPPFLFFVYFKMNKHLGEICDENMVEYKGNYLIWLIVSGSVYLVAGAGMVLFWIFVSFNVGFIILFSLLFLHLVTAGNCTADYQIAESFNGIWDKRNASAVVTVAE